MSSRTGGKVLNREGAEREREREREREGKWRRKKGVSLTGDKQDKEEMCRLESRQENVTLRERGRERERERERESESA